MKKTDGKAENAFREYKSVHLARSSDQVKRKLHEYYLRNKQKN